MRRRRSTRLILPAVVALAAGLVWMQVAAPTVTGDEPHYVVVADSLVHHHTLDLHASYSDPSGVRRFVPTLHPHVVVKSDGRWMPWPQGIGLPVLIAPAWWLRHSFRAVRLELLAIGVLLCMQLWLLMGEIRPRWRDRTGAWFFVIASLPIVAYMSQIYPDLPAALLVAIALRMLVRLHRDVGSPTRALVLLSICAGLLPWFHIRYLTVAAGLVVAAVILALRRPDVRRRSLAVATLPAIVGVVLLGGLYLWMYGTILPSTLSKFVASGSSVHWSFVGAYRYGFGSLLGESRGLLVFAPVYLMLSAAALAALWIRRRDPATLVVGLAVVLYVFGVLPYATFGSDLPSRYVVVLVPVIVAGAAYALPVRASIVLPALVLGVVSIAVAFGVATQLEHTIVSPTSARIARVYDRAFPRVELLKGVDGVSHTAIVPESAPHAAVYAPWPADRLRRAAYVARATIAAGRGVPQATQTVTVEAIDDRGEFAHTLLAVGPTPAAATLRFTTRADDSVVRIILVPRSPQSAIVGGRLSLQRTGPAPDRSQPTHDDLPKAALWCLALLVLATVMVRFGQAPRTSAIPNDVDT